jgi:hypothetical protein
VAAGAILVRAGLLSESPQRLAKPAPVGADAAPRFGDHQTRQLDPKIAVLSASDLPDYKLISSAVAIQAEGGSVPNSWDNLLQRSQPGAPDYRMAEAVVVVYRTEGDAVADVELLRRNHESQGVKSSPGLLVSQSMTWSESAGVPGYTLVHAVFRIEHVVAEVTMLGQDNPVLVDELHVFAAAQQVRLSALLHDSA